MQNTYPIESVRCLRYLHPSNRFYFSRYVRPEWEERFSAIQTDAPIDPHRLWTYPTKQTEAVYCPQCGTKGIIQIEQRAYGVYWCNDCEIKFTD